MKIIFIIMILFSCKLWAQSTDYFPAHIGDIYIYESHDYESDYKTYDTTTVTNIIQKSDGGIDIYYNNATQPRYYKAADGNVYQYFNNAPYLWYDFTVASQDTFETESYGSQLFVVVYYGGATLFGRNISARSFSFINKKYPSSRATQWLGDGIGVFGIDQGYFYPPSTSSLIGCIINGKGYGTLVSVKADHTITNYKLYQNYPNPFNSSTIIKYELQTPSHITLVIYNVQGIQVEKLVDEYKNSGIYSINFNASKYSSGIYFYKLSSNNYQIIKKLVYIK